MHLLKNFIADESGATAIEYGLIAALIAVAMIGGASMLGNQIDDKFQDVATTLSDVNDEATVNRRRGRD